MEDESSCERGSIEGGVVRIVQSVRNTDKYVVADDDTTTSTVEEKFEKTCAKSVEITGKQVNIVEDDDTTTSVDNSTSTVEEKFNKTCAKSVEITGKQVNIVEDDDTTTSVDNSTSTVEEQFDETCGESTSTHDSFCHKRYGKMEEVDDNEEIAAFLTRFSHLKAGGHFPTLNVEGIGEFGASCNNKDPEVEVDLVYGFVKKANMASIANIRGLEAKSWLWGFLSKKKKWVSNSRGWAVKKHLKLSRENRTKAHPGYSGVDIESLHRHCEAVRDQPNISFKENSAKSSGDWIGMYLKIRVIVFLKICRK
uniref:Uncharacterized protein n=1 Tax=Ditylum brightwellii TaxID=49249 RepID=A0A6V2CLE0_9STRA